EALRRATAGDGDVRSDVGERGSGPRPGSVVVWRRDPEATQWLVTRWRDGAGQVVPVDDAPWHGSHDFDLSSFVGEPFQARCAAAVELGSGADLEPVWQLPASVADEALDAVHRRIESLGRETPPTLEIDGEAIYREHLATLERIGARLTAAMADGALPEDGSGGDPDPLPPDNVRPFAAAGPTGPTLQKRWTPWLAAAACAVAALGLGLRSGHIQSQLQSAGAEIGAVRLELAETRTQLEAALQPSVVPQAITGAIPMEPTRSLNVAKIEIPLGYDKPRIVVELLPPALSEEFTSSQLQVFEGDSTGTPVIDEPSAYVNNDFIDLPALPKEYTVVYLGVRADGSIAKIYARTLRIRSAEERFTSP
ncbi:MAG: hypothetical protein AAFX50_20405, partial [Acidobacteriota bacterium]